MSVSPDLELLPHPRGGWQVRQPGSTRALRVFKKRDKVIALLWAKNRARSNGGRVLRPKA